MKCTVIIALLSILISNGNCRGLKEEFTWTRITYEWPNQNRVGRQANVKPGESILFPGSTNDATNNYIYENNIPMGANRWQNKLFITVPRRRAGVPSTLNYVWLNSTEKHNVPLIPYPDWEINQLPASGETGNIVSVYRTAVDSCNRLWMVDTGLIEIPDNNVQVQPPAIVIIDLLTNQVIRKYVLKSTDVRPGSTLASIVIDVTPKSCGDAYAYIPDLSGYGLVVYNFKENDSWRVTHNYFYLEPKAGDFFIGGLNFQWNDGVFSVELSDIKPDGFKTLYFHSMAGYHIYSISTRILRDQQLATRSYHENDFKIVVDRGEGSQTSSADLHVPSGVLFLGLVNQNALGCWNVKTRPIPEHFGIVYKDDIKFIYPCDVKIANDDVIVLTNTMPIFLYGRLNYDLINFRVWITNINEAIKDTPCAGVTLSPRKPGY